MKNNRNKGKKGMKEMNDIFFKSANEIKEWTNDKTSEIKKINERNKEGRKNDNIRII